MDWIGARRLRRNRRSAGLRDLLRETVVRVEDLVWPVFVRAGGGEPEEVASMPGVMRWTVDGLVRECGEAARLGIRAVAIFPVIAPELKDEVGAHAVDEANVLFAAVRAVKAAVPELIVITDVALDPYTDHGHDGLISEDGMVVMNDQTVAALCELAVAEARAGADLVAPSDMMDGRVAAIREALDGAGFEDVGILSYAAKFASAFYGPFRDAVGSKVAGKGVDKRTYQMDPGNAREAWLEVALDEAEGADMVMVKPAGAYLDIIRGVRERTDLPVAAYQVSGEYAQIHAAARLGWLDYAAARDESLLAIKRAGADFVLTYFAREIAEGR